MLLVLRLTPWIAIIFSLLSAHAVYKMNWRSIFHFGGVAIIASLLTWFGIGLAPPVVILVARAAALFMPLFLWYVHQRYQPRMKMLAQIEELLDEEDLSSDSSEDGVADET